MVETRGEEQGVALVTGGAKRIGAGLVRGLAADGFAVAIHCRRSAADGEALAEEIRRGGGRATVVTADLADAAEVGGLVAAAGRLGPVTCLVNSASLFEHDRLGDLDEALWDRHFAVNLRAPAFLARDMAAALPDGQRGVIVNLLDQKLWNPNPDFLSYTLTKHGLQALTDLLARELAPRIRVVGVAPGLTLPSGNQTPEEFAQAHTKTPLGYGSRLEDVVEAVRYLVRSPAITGHTLLVDAGQHLQPRGRDVMFERERD